MKLVRPFTYVLLLFAQILTLKWLRGHPGWVEVYYSNGIFPYLSKGFRYALGWIPFSFGDIMYAALIILLIVGIVNWVRLKFKNTLNLLTRVLLVTNLVFFAFHAIWGLNYYRLPLHQALNIEHDYDTQQLISLTQRLVKRSNALHLQLQPNDSLPVEVPYSLTTVFQKSIAGFATIEESFPKLDYTPKSIKNSLFRYPLTYMGFSGYLNPISQEGQINGLIPKHRWPLVSCHEEAHQLGFAKENEANFIAVMSTTSNEDVYFKYSGYIFALRYCLTELYLRDGDVFDILKSQIRPGILANYRESATFWAQYENPLEPLLEKLYGGYLKANNQPQGMASYNYVVALLVNYFDANRQLP
ncbi:MAG: DUF3810 domain-containing protein [Leeuwenhoekiella sp.]